MIEVAPVIDGDATEPTAAQKAAAKTKADKALATSRVARPGTTIAKTVSTDASTAPQAGDLGWLGR